MRILQVTGDQGIASLELIERPIPTPGPDEVIVKVAAVSLNHRDLTMVNLKAPGTPAPPFAPMSDCAGRVHAIGSNVDNVAVGDRVTSLFFQRWLDGAISPAVRWDTVPSAKHDGVAAEYVKLLAQGVAPAPASLSDHEAATLPCAALTAWRAMFEETKLAPGAKVLIQGTGGVAIFALQFAVAAGYQAIVTSSSDEKLAFVQKLGATHGINYQRHPQWGAEAKRLAGSGGVDFVLGVGGAGNLTESLDVLGLGGTIAIIGMLGGTSENLAFRALVGKNARLQGISVGSRAMFTRMSDFIETHRIKPVISQIYDFADVIAAFHALKSGAHIGKIVVKFAG